MELGAVIGYLKEAARREVKRYIILFSFALSLYLPINQ